MESVVCLEQDWEDGQDEWFKSMLLIRRLALESYSLVKNTNEASIFTVLCL